MAITVKIRKTNGKFFPCMKCKFKNSENPRTPIHVLQQRSKSYFQNVGSNRPNGFTEFIGECPDFEQQS